MPLRLRAESDPGIPVGPRVPGRVARLLPSLLLLSASAAVAFSGGPPPLRAGDPGADTCAGASCHDDSPLGSGDVGLEILDDVGRPFASWEPGQLHRLGIRLRSGEADRARWGFELTFVADAVAAGQITALGATRVLSAIDRDYLGHFPAVDSPDGALWSLSWRAPADPTAAVTLHACGNAADGDGTPRGDFVQCVALPVEPIEDVVGDRLFVLRLDTASSWPAFTADPCRRPEDARTCDEAGEREVIDEPVLPVSLDGRGALVLIEYDSDAATPGTDDSLRVRRGEGGELVVTRRPR